MKNSFLIVSLLALLACKKQVPGPQGDAGTNGKNGNTDIGSTAAFTVKSANWDSIVQNDKWSWERIIAVDGITKSVLSAGDVMVYKKVNNDWYPLPVFEGFLCTQAMISEGSLKLQLTHLHGAIPARPADQVYRVVVLSAKQ